MNDNKSLFLNIQAITSNPDFGTEPGRYFEAAQHLFTKANEAATLTYITFSHEVASAPQSYRETQIADIEIQTGIMVNPEVSLEIREKALRNLCDYNFNPQARDQKYNHDAQVAAFNVVNSYQKTNECSQNFRKIFSNVFYEESQ